MPLHTTESAFTGEVLRKIFSFESDLSDRLTSRENGKLEFKETFDMGSADKYAKTAAAFANAQGGYIVFGVKDSPRQMIGLKSQNFENFDVGKMTAALNEWLSPEIEWESYVWEIRGYKVGLLFFSEALHKPVVCMKNGKVMQEGAIYYRYRGRSETIKYAELRRILEEQKERERNLWFKQLKKMADVGVEQVAVLDLQSGEVTGAKGNFFISEELLPRLQFLREGHFVETEGSPSLKLIGDLHAAEGPMFHSTIKVPTTLREPEIFGAFLRREAVINPTDYIASACYEQSPFFPLYYFIQQTTESVPDTIELIKGMNIRGVVRNKIIARLQLASEELAIGKLNGAGAAAVSRRLLHDKLRSKSIETADIQADNKLNVQQRLLEAVTHTDSTFDQEYIFGLLEEYYLHPLAQLGGNTRSAFRKAVCHLDIVWYKALAN
ncbi:ATP-binding protein [Edaphobacter paludis]|uniref:ATP-binding protein n=1 Tax=Edaphobacter paludis TaxID=3035702 RepID=A0AAU7D782_9BACT